MISLVCGICGEHGIIDLDSELQRWLKIKSTTHARAPAQHCETGVTRYKEKD